MDRMSFDDQPDFLRDTLSAWGAAANGVTSKTSRERQNYWRHWCAYVAATHIDPYLHPDTVPTLEHNIITSPFLQESGLVSTGEETRSKLVGSQTTCGCV